MSGQLALYEYQERRASPRPSGRDTGGPGLRPTPAAQGPLCASCRAREARYGFQPDRDDPQVGRPRTLCFECFRIELARRQEAAHAVQARLPLEQTLETLTRRRRRAQMAARRALGL